MDKSQRFIWASAGLIAILSAIGFFVIPSDARVHTQFDLDGWTTSYTRNVSLLIYIGAGLLAAFVLNLRLGQVSLPWFRWFALGIMTFLPAVQLLAIIHAAN